MSLIPLHRVVTVTPWIDYLSEQEIPGARELSRANLPHRAMEDPDCFIPSQNVWRFIANVAEYPRMKRIGFDIGSRTQPDCVDPKMLRRLHRAPTVAHGLKSFCRFATADISRVSLWLQQANVGSYRMYYRTSYGPNEPACIHFQWYGLLSIINAIRVYAGDNWLPDEIGLVTEAGPDRVIRNALSPARFLTAQDYCFVGLERRIIEATSEPGSGTRILSDKPPDLETKQNFSGSMRQLLQSYLLDAVPTIEEAAGIIDMSVRALQRNLASEGTTYRKVLEQARVEMACTRLRGTNTKVADIALALGYSDASHFTRAFRQLMQITPIAYRKGAINPGV